MCPLLEASRVAQLSQSTSTMQHDRCDQRLPILREKKELCFRNLRGSLIMCPVMCVYFISFGRFIFVCVYRISEVLSSWRLGTKVKHAVNNVDSALNFVTGFFFKKIQPRRLHPAWPSSTCKQKHRPPKTKPDTEISCQNACSLFQFRFQCCDQRTRTEVTVWFAMMSC